LFFDLCLSIPDCPIYAILTYGLTYAILAKAFMPVLALQRIGAQPFSDKRIDRRYLMKGEANEEVYALRLYH
jgi:hypothetical protein